MEQKLDNAISQLRAYRSVLDNRLYEHYTPEQLQKELAGIDDSIKFLESLIERRLRPH